MSTLERFPLRAMFFQGSAYCQGREIVLLFECINSSVSFLSLPLSEAVEKMIFVDGDESEVIIERKEKNRLLFKDVVWEVVKIRLSRNFQRNFTP